VLRELGVTATVFVSTAFLDGDVFPFDAWGVRWQARAPRDAYRPLTAAECLEMRDSGLIDFGAHTHTHRNLTRDPDAFLQDLRTSIDIVHERFGVARVPFAFPWGRPHLGFVSDPLVAAARAAGAVSGLTTENRPVDPRTDPFTWGRFNVYDSDSAATIAAKVDGWYGWAPGIQEWWSRGRRGAPIAAPGGAS
jgi:peptidoglycan/xylan/chitin deacetylase (PgdA/CDA1 family)